MPNDQPAPDASTDAGALPTATLATNRQPGAIGIIQLHYVPGDVLEALTGRADWPIGVMRLVDLAGVDRGLVARLSDDLMQLLPHGGPRVVQRLLEWLNDHGVKPIEPSSGLAATYFPEAADAIEAAMLESFSRAASPLAIDLLVDQPRRWRAFEGPWTADDETRSKRLCHLITPPLVVLAGQANVGKSTLSNALLGRSMSVSIDRPGTTRDYVAGRIDLGGLVVDWHDTPGLRATDDPIERGAQELAGRLIDGADLVVAMTDHAQPWPSLPRRADLQVAGKADLGDRPEADLQISAQTGRGLAELVRTVRDRLVPAEDRTCRRPWRFSDQVPN